MQSQLPKIPEAKMRALTSEVQGSNLSLETQQTLVELLKFCQNLGAFLVAQEIKMEKLKRLAFEGKKTEKKKRAQLTLATSKATVPVAAGHGRKGANEYPGAERVIVDQHLQAGDCCPDCARGKLYSMPEASDAAVA